MAIKLNCFISKNTQKITKEQGGARSAKSWQDKFERFVDDAKHSFFWTFFLTGTLYGRKRAWREKKNTRTKFQL